MVVLAITFVVGAATAAQATIGGFNGGDGTEAGGDCTTTLDWACLTSSQLVTMLDPAAGSDLAISGSENNPDQWVIGPGPVPDAKDDIAANWSYSFTNATFTNNYFAFAFYRGSGNGDSDVDFELNQGTAKYVNSQHTSVICRTNGDILLAFDVQSGASNGTVHMYKWTWTSGTPCTSTGTGSFQLLGGLPAGVVEGALNQATITNSLSTGALGNSFAPGTFGETAVDLTALGNAVAPAGGCEFFNHVQLTSRSSKSFGSTMEDFSDQGNVFARLCNGGGGGGGGCTSFPSVAITSPADNSVDSSSTVTLTGTSDQQKIEVDDGQTVVANVDVTSGKWSLTLQNVANGAHSYTAVATDVHGCTKTATVHVNVSASGNGNGGGGGGGGNGGGGGTGGAGGTGSGGVVSGAVAGPWLACTNTRTLSVADVYPWAGKARVTGFAPIGSVGKVVTIIAAWTHKVLGTAQVLGDNSFRATVPLPPTRLRSSARGAYLAQLGNQTSAPLGFSRRLYNTRITIRFTKERVTTFKIKRVNGKRKRVKVTKLIAVHTVTFVGTVVKPFANPRRQVVIRGASTCAKVASGQILARANVNAKGRFSVTFNLPSSLLRYHVIFLRAQTVVARPQPRGKKARPSQNRPIAVFGITRGVHVS